MIVGRDPTGVCRIKPEYEPIKKPPARRSAIEKQPIHLRCQPLNMSVFGEGRLLGNGFAIDMDYAPGPSGSLMITGTSRAEIDGPVRRF